MTRKRQTLQASIVGTLAVTGLFFSSVMQAQALKDAAVDVARPKKPIPPGCRSRQVDPPRLRTRAAQGSERRSGAAIKSLATIKSSRRRHRSLMTPCPRTCHFHHAECRARIPSRPAQATVGCKQRKPICLCPAAITSIGSPATGTVPGSTSGYRRTRLSFNGIEPTSSELDSAARSVIRLQR